MSLEEWRLVAGLTMLRVYLGPLVSELLFEGLEPEVRRDLARELRRVANDLDGVPGTVRAQQHAEQPRLAEPTSLRRRDFTASGP